METQTELLHPEVKEFLKETKKMIINGKLVASKSGKTFETLNPANGEVLAKVYEAGEEDVDDAVKAAREAFEEGPWSDMSGAEKGKLMYALADLMEENKEILAQLDTLDN